MLRALALPQTEDSSEDRFRHEEKSAGHDHAHRDAAEKLHVRCFEIIGGKEKERGGGGKAKKFESRACHKQPINETVKQAEEKDRNKHPYRPEIDVALCHVPNADRCPLLGAGHADTGVKRGPLRVVDGSLVGEKHAGRENMLYGIGPELSFFIGKLLGDVSDG